MLPQTNRQMALDQYRLRANFYDAELAAFEPVRRKAIAGLQLQPGNTVLDVGCGTGLSLESLQQGVGSQGTIVGIEQSPEMFALAHRRVARHKWRNVTLENAPAESSTVGCRADSALFLFTHDILRYPDGIRHLGSEAQARRTGGGCRPAMEFAVGLANLLAGAAVGNVFDNLSGRSGAALGPFGTAGGRHAAAALTTAGCLYC
ncbi:class I SAM-dependent methyltransferase [Rhodoferax antarcticus]|uniref:Methyltransferase type 11 n=1 Tax=Rhodoferax antarcticus ANT.BR TaxID=1111071 RepID=A0A1Q8YK92_9BURK|nr:methyltransferase domain-containing protein [Rhodoferax antarcticus]APW47564.1 hypothetical protein RA876_15755 [Rhodoferax antarcticus]OLP08349.1 methyltransferase type 11 [Rhodoferax antarcticus ANT.BR]